jgi:hypothetical protein
MKALLLSLMVCFCGCASTEYQWKRTYYYHRIPLYQGIEKKQPEEKFSIEEHTKIARDALLLRKGHYEDINCA